MTDNEVRLLMAKVEAMLISQAEVRADVKAIRADNDKADLLHIDHENRIRSLEKFSWKLAGAFALAGGGLGALATALAR